MVKILGCKFQMKILLKFSYFVFLLGNWPDFLENALK